MKLNHTICILLLALLAGVPAGAQDVVCSADPYGLYSVDTEENNGEGSTHAVYVWTVIPVGAVITPDQGPNGSSNVVSVDWSAVAPGTYTLEVVETDTITGCVGEIIELEVQLEDPLQPVIVCTPVATDQVDFNWNAVAGATGYEIEAFVNGVSVNSFGNYQLTSIEVTGLSPNDEVTIEVTPLGSGQACFEMGTQTCNSVACLTNIIEEEDVTICDSQLPYNWNGNAYNAGGSYQVTLQTAAGCDSIATLNLTVNPAVTGSEDVTICDSQLPYNWNGNAYNAGGSYEVTLQTAAGCDSIVTLNLTVNIAGASPALECWETATLNDLTCAWEVEGTQPEQPLEVNCWDNYQFQGASCSWVNIGTEPLEPAAANCWDNYQFSEASCAWENLGSPADVPTAGITPSAILIDCNNSSVILTASGAGSYAWQDGSGNSIGTGASVSVSQGGTYTLTVTAANGCFDTASVTISQDSGVPQVTIDAAATILNCETTTIALTASATVSGGSFSWSDGSLNTNTISVSAAGDYEVTFTADNGCEATDIITITEDSGTPQVQINPSAPNFTCAVNSITLAATGADSYVWSTGETGNSITVTAAGPYSVTGSTANGCDDVANIVLGTDLTAPVASITSPTLELTCDIDEIILTALGGGTYNWNNGLSSSASLTVTTAGDYTVVVESANGCTDAATVTVTQNADVPVAEIVASEPELNCNVTSLILTGSGGVSYSWAGGLGNDATLNVTTPGPYSLVVTAANGCQVEAVYDVTEDVTAPSVTITNLDNTSELTCTVTEIDVQATGAVSYAWSNGLGFSDFATITQPGTYIVTGTADNGCTADASIEIISDGNLPVVQIINNTGTDVLTCNEQSISVTVSSSIAGDIAWDNGLGTNPDQTFTLPGTYSVTVVDAATGCEGTASITIGQDIELPLVEVFNSTGEDAITCDITSIDLFATGGVSYVWSNDAGTVISNTDALQVTTGGTYTVVATATNGCQNNADYQVGEDVALPSVNITASIDVIDCANPSSLLTATGGGTYSWSNGLGSASSVTVTAADIYTVTVTGDNGCDDVASITIAEDFELPGASIGADNAELNCVITSSTLSASGNGSFEWGSGLGNAASITVNDPGIYTLVVTGVNGCTSNDQFEVTEDVTPVVASVTPSNVQLTCTAEEILLTANGGVSYEWSNGLTDAAINVNVPDTYTVTVTGANGCTDDAVAVVTQSADLPVIAINATEPVLNCDIATSLITASGANTYTWTDEAGVVLGNSASLVISEPGVYSVSGLATNGCTGGASYEVTGDFEAPTAFISNVTGTSVLTCYVSQITLEVIGGASYQWNFGLGSSDVVNVQDPNNYSVLVTGSNGCEITLQYAITENTQAPILDVVSLDGTFELSCNITSIDVQASGGFVYEWDSGLGFGANQTLTVPGQYLLTSTGQNGCVSTELVTVTEDVNSPSIAIVNNSGTNTITCSTTSISLTANGAVSYEWFDDLGNSVSTDASYTASAPGVYTVIGIGSNGCDGSNTYTVLEDTAVPAFELTNLTGTSELTCDVAAIDVELVYAEGTPQWNQLFGSNDNVEITAPGVYTVVLTSANGCASSASISITQNIAGPGAVITNITGVTQLDCLNSIIQLQGTGNGTVSWSGGSVSGNQTEVSSAGDYTLTITGANGCESTDVVTISEDTSLAVAIINAAPDVTQIDCVNESITLTASGGVSYEWTDDLGNILSSDAALVVSASGNYTVEAMAANGCVDTESIFITEDIVVPNVIVSTVPAATELTCELTEIALTASGADTYEWTDGVGSIVGTGDVLLVSQPGIYTASGILANGCESNNAVAITQDIATPGASITNLTGATTLTCDLNAIELQASGNGSFSWSNGSVVVSTIADLTVGTQGTYTVTVTGTNGCTSEASVAIDSDGNIPGVSINNLTGEDVLTCEVESINVQAVGTGSFEWTDASGIVLANSSTLTITAPGDYTVTLTASNGCEASAVVSVSENVALPVVDIINTTGSDVLTCTLTAINLTATGGVSYVWLGGELGADLVATAADAYTVTATGANGCENNASYSITEDIVLPTLVITNTTNATELTCDLVQVDVVASGADTYDWTDAFGVVVGNTAALSISEPGEYTVEGTSANGCAAVSIVTITQNIDAPIAGITNLDNATTLTCQLNAIDLVATGGVEFSWSNVSEVVSTTAAITVGTIGTYTVTVTGANGCTSEVSITIDSDGNIPVVSINNVTNDDVLTCSVIAINLEAQGTGTFEWTNASGVALGSASMLTITEPGDYTVTLTASNGCEASAAVSISEDVALPVVDIINATGTEVLTCLTTSIDLTATGGVSYAWTGGELVAGLTVNTEGTYTVTATGANGCEATQSIVITEDNQDPIIAVDNVTNETVLTCDVPSITLVASGATSYSWANESAVVVSSEATLVVSAAGTYTVIGIASNGCTSSQVVVIIEDFAIPTVAVVSDNTNDQLTCIDNSTTLTASGAVSYVWANGLGTTNQITAGSAGTYIVEGFGLNGCSVEASIIITTDGQLPTVSINASATELDCITLQATLTANTSDNVNWSNGLGSSTSVVVNAAGTYTVTATSANGCTAQASVVVTQDVAPVVAGIVNNTGTTQLAGGVTSINVSATGGGTYAWDNALGTNATVDLTSVGTYTVTVTGDNGCVDTESITITNCTPPVVTIANNSASTTLTCVLTEIEVQASGADSYVWSNGLGTADLATITSAVTYTVTGTTSDGCSSEATITIGSDVTAPVAGITNNTGTNVLTCVLNAINVTATGGGTYAWDNGLGSAPTATIGSAGTYTVTVTAANGCTDTESIVVTTDGSVPSPSIANTTGTTVLDCNTPSISVVASGGVSYAWSDGLGASANATIANPGTYTVTVTASNGCTGTASINVTEDVAVTAGITNTDGTTILSCAQTSIDVTATGGVSYSWSNGLGNTDNASITAPGNYTVTVTAANGCVDTESITITNDGSAPVIGITNNTGTTALDCNTISISLTATGGTTYTWNNGLGGAATVAVTEPGIYTVTSTASNGCQGEASITITEDVLAPVAGILNNSGTSILTCLQNSISLTATGGGTYSWSNGLGSNADVIITSTGDYTVTVTADNGCTDTETISVTDDGSLPQPSITSSVASNTLDCINGTITLTGSGAGTFSWSSGATNLGSGNSIEVADAGTYTLTLTASNGCVASTSITIAEDIAVSAAITADAPFIDCNNPDMLLTASGGVSYAWSNGLGNAASATVTTAGNYTVTVTAANGCTDQETIAVVGNFNTLNVAITNNTGTNVLGCNNNSISVTATGGVSYQWTNSLGNAASATITSPGTYSVTATGANGCVNTTSITITQDNALPAAGITNVTGTTIINCTVTAIQLQATGAGTYTWSNGLGNNASAVVTDAGTYTVTVTAPNGCTDTDSITITEDNAAPTAGITNALGNTELSCSVNSISVTATGGGSYNWSGGLGSNATIELTQPGTYTVTVTSPNGCTDTESITITDDGSLPQITIEATTNELNCFTSSIELTATGDAGTLTWSVDGNDCPGVPNTALICSDFYDPICGCDGVTYSNPCYAEREGGVLYYLPGECGSTDGAGSIVVSNPGTYTVTLDVNGCIATYSFEVEENLEVPSADVSAASPICSNENAVFTITGTAGDVVNYTTNGGASIQTITMDASGSNNIVVNAPSADVTLELIDATRGNCFAELDAIATVVVVTAPNANATGPAFALCEGLTLALTSQEIAGATYSWTGPGGFNSGNSDVFIPNADVADAGEYIYSVSVGNCVDYDTVNVAIALPTSATQNVTLCIGQTFTLPSGISVSAEGIYTSDLFNSFGCDSTVTTTITVVDEFIVELEAAICDGEAYVLPDGSSQTQSGTYTFEFVSSGGCDSTVTVVIDVHPTYYALQTISICEGDSYILADGTSASTSDLYEVIFTTDAGCDSIVAVQLNVLPLPSPFEIQVDLCFGETTTLVDGTVVNVSGSYPVVLQAANGCDSLQISNVRVWPNYNDTIEVVICYNEQYELLNGVIVSDGGNYLVLDTQSSNGCDSTLVIAVTELAPIVQEITEQLCFNQAYIMPDGASIDAEGVYDFVLTSATGCDSLVSIQLEIADQIFGAPEQVLLCFGETHTLPNGEVISDNGEYTSVLSTSAGCDSLIVSSVVALDYIFTEVAAFACQGETYTLPDGQSVSNNGVFQSTLINEVGCDSAVQVTLTFTPQVMVSIIPEVDSLTVCSGDTLLLIADGASFFDWDSANPLSSAEGAVIEAYPTTDGFITVSGSNEGCSAMDSIYVSVNALPEMQIVAPDAICMGDSVVISAGGADSIVWMNNDYLPCLTCADNTVSPSESTVFMVGGYNGECFGTTSFAMEVQALPVASVFGDTLVCAFSAAELYATGGESYVWSTGETTSSISVEPGATTIYQVIALSGICADTTVVTVEAIPLPDVTTNNDTTITLGGDVQLFATGGVSYSWSPATDLSCSTCFNPIAIPSETTVYCVEAISDRGCADTACVRIEVTDECETFFMPNAFAPERGGHELNDCFRPFGEECFASMRMRVFDRWGELVFESTSFDECWDGNYQGKKVNAGVFVYYFDGLLINGDPFYRKGNVTVIR